jgi:hypothetical protein
MERLVGYVQPSKCAERRKELISEVEDLMPYEEDWQRLFEDDLEQERLEEEIADYHVPPRSKFVRGGGKFDKVTPGTAQTTVAPASVPAISETQPAPSP